MRAKKVHSLTMNSRFSHEKKDLVWLAKKANGNFETDEMTQILHEIEVFINQNEYKRTEITVELQMAEAFKMLVEEKLEAKGK